MTTHKVVYTLNLTHTQTLKIAFYLHIYVHNTIVYNIYLTIVDNLRCFLQEVAAEVVQKLQPREAPAVFIEVKSEDQGIYPILFWIA